MLVANTAWNLWNYRRSLLRALEAQGDCVLLAAPPDDTVPDLQQHTPARFFPLRHLSRKSLSVLGNFRLLLELYLLFRRERPDVIMLFTIKPNILGNIAARLAGVPVVSVVEGLGTGGAEGWRWLAMLLFRFALRRTARVVFLNREDCLEFLRHRLVRPEQVRRIAGPGIDLRHFQFLEKIPARPFVFLYSGRLLKQKGICEFAEAARRLEAEGAAAECRVLGGPDAGNPGSIAPEQIRQWATQGFLQHLGRADDVRPALLDADVLVLPSYYREGVPRSILEAMALGKIIITTDTPGCRDTVDEGQNGFLVPPRNVEALLDAMRRALLLSPDVCRAMSAHSLRKVRAVFSDEVVLPQYLELLADFPRNPRAGHTLPK